MSGTPATDALDAMGIDTVCARITDGKSLTAIAKEAKVSKGSLLAWLAADVDRSARAREARRMTARLWDEKAEAGLRKAADPFELAKARELASHYRWRSSKTAPAEYGDRLTHAGDADAPIGVHHSGEVAIDPGEAYRRLLNGDG